MGPARNAVRRPAGKRGNMDCKRSVDSRTKPSRVASEGDSMLACCRLTAVLIRLDKKFFPIGEWRCI